MSKTTRLCKKIKNFLALTLSHLTYLLENHKLNLTNTVQQVHALQAQIKANESLVAERQAQLTNTQKSTKRTITLVHKKLYSQASGDLAISQLKVATAALTAAKAQLEQSKQQLGTPGIDNAQVKVAQAAVQSAKLQLSYTQVYAPVTGYLANMTLQPGNSVTSYQPIFSIINKNTWWVSANFKETQLERIKQGQPAEIQIDMYPHHIFHGTVASFSPSSGTSFALLPPENATGNWVKVTQRFPVWIDIKASDPKYPFRIGASCTVTIDTTV